MNKLPPVHFDWAHFSMVAHDHLDAFDRLLTNYPPAQKLDLKTRDEAIGHLKNATQAMAQMAAWVRAH